MNCKVCNKELKLQQKLYCSQKCYGLKTTKNKKEVYDPERIEIIRKILGIDPLY